MAMVWGSAVMQEDWTQSTHTYYKLTCDEMTVNGDLPQINAVINRLYIMNSVNMSQSVRPLHYLWFQKCKYTQQDFLMWSVILEMEGLGSLRPGPLYQRSSRYQVCHSLCPSRRRWHPALSVKAAHPPLLPSALEWDEQGTVNKQSCVLKGKTRFELLTG